MTNSMKDFWYKERFQSVLMEALNMKLGTLGLTMYEDEDEDLVGHYMTGYDKWYKSNITSVIDQIKEAEGLDEDGKIDMTTVTSVVMFHYYVSEIILTELIEHLKKNPPAEG